MARMSSSSHLTTPMPWPLALHAWPLPLFYVNDWAALRASWRATGKVAFVNA